MRTGNETSWRSGGVHRVALLLVATILSVACRPSTAAEAEPTHSVGLASVDITPDFAVRLNGFGGRTKESEGVRLPIHARAIAIGPLADGSTPAAADAAARAGGTAFTWPVV